MTIIDQLVEIAEAIEPKDEFRFYVYAYLRDDGTPYYIGKGTKRRAYYKIAGEIKLPKDKKNIVILERNLSNIGALALERRMIRWYGRKDIGTGILRNLSDGGDGTLLRKLTEAQKLHLSKCNKGKKATDKTKAKMSALAKLRSHSDETKIKMRESRIRYNTDIKYLPYLAIITKLKMTNFGLTLKLKERLDNT